MCGRFSLTAPEDAVAEAFDLDDVPPLGARYNVAPGQHVLAVGRRRDGARARAALLRWGQPRREGRPLVNRRCESLAGRAAARERRCLLPADGFYEWRSRPARQPFLFRPVHGGLLALAALWQPAREPGTPATCAILTTRPNAEVAAVHTRMPVVLPPTAWERWLDPSAPLDAHLAAWLQPLPDGSLSVRAVGPYVNAALHEGPACWEPA